MAMVVEAARSSIPRMDPVVVEEAVVGSRSTQPAKSQLAATLVNMARVVVAPDISAVPARKLRGPAEMA